MAKIMSNFISGCMVIRATMARIRASLFDSRMEGRRNQGKEMSNNMLVGTEKQLKRERVTVGSKQNIQRMLSLCNVDGTSCDKCCSSRERKLDISVLL